MAKNPSRIPDAKPPPERKTDAADDAEKIKQSLGRHVRAAAGRNAGKLREEMPWVSRKVRDV